MTTFTFRGYTFREARNGSIASYKKVDFSLVVSDDHSFRYSLLPRTDDGSRYINATRTGSEYQMRLGGVTLSDGIDLFAANLRWKGQTHTILGFDLPNGDTFFMGMGGKPLPNLNSLSSFRKFAQEATFSDPTGAFGPGKTILLKNFVSKSAQTENDRLTLTENTFTDGREIETGRGNDRVTGNSASNVIDLGSGNDTANGGGGEDTIIGGTGNDRLSGGSESDSLSGGLGNDRLNGDSGDDTLSGDAGNDSLVGGDGDDLLQGGDGADTLVGSGGDDSLDGGAGDDRIDSGSGADTLTGGTGTDRFVFTKSDTPLTATITDFEADDLVELRMYELNGVKPEVVQEGSDVVLSLGPDTLIVFQNTTAATVSDGILTPIF